MPGTPQGTVYVDASVKDEQGNTVVFGRGLFGNNGILRPQDINLRIIRSFQASPWVINKPAMVAGSIGSQSTKRYDRTFAVVQGSLGSLGVLDASSFGGSATGNYVRIQALRMTTFGSFTMKSAAPQGTKGLYIGTQAGSIRFSYTAAGA